MILPAKLSGLLIVALTGAEIAATDPLTDCNDNPDPAAQIRGCTEYIDQAPSDKHNLAIAYVNRAIARSLTGDQESALADFTAAIELDPGSSLAYYNRGNLYLDTGRYDLAIADFTAAISLDPLFALAHYNRGLAYEQVGNIAAASADFQRALTLDPSHEQAQKHLDAIRH